MSALLDFGFDRVWTRADLDTLPDDIHWRRVEIVDGVLIVSPQATPRHGFVVDELTAVLRAARTDGLHVTSSMGVEYGRTYRVPDVAVIARAAANKSTDLVPSDLVLAVEVESPSSITTDRITKPAEYAAAGIAFYWRVERDPLRLVSFRLAGDRYEQTGEWSAGETARITEPFEVEIELRALVP